jgi:hypothetical protein
MATPARFGSQRKPISRLLALTLYACCGEAVMRETLLVAVLLAGRATALASWSTVSRKLSLRQGFHWRRPASWAVRSDGSSLVIWSEPRVGSGTERHPSARASHLSCKACSTAPCVFCQHGNRSTSAIQRLRFG